MTRYAVRPISLERVVSDSSIGTILGDGSVVVLGVTQDSRDVVTGDLYFCVPGQTFDGHHFADDAIKNGASALVVDHFIEHIEPRVPQIVVPDVRSALGPIAALLFGSPAQSLKIVGVTGTNGKTSTCAILGNILQSSGAQVLVLGTLTSKLTTPEAIDLQHDLNEHLQKGGTHVVMEVSSHALSLKRVSGIMFDVAVFTNFGRDHLDYHLTEEAYFAAKASLFTSSMTRGAVINRDDPRGLLLLDVTQVNEQVHSVSFGIAELSDVLLEVSRVSFTWHNAAVSVPIGGRFTLMNTLAAITTADVLGISVSDIVKGCACVPVIPGRFELVSDQLGFDVVVDYAHTPDGMVGVLTSARAVTSGRVIVVFGCGGNRDSGKRPLMGAVAQQHADVCYVTSDNPRTEDSDRIIREIIEGMAGEHDAVFPITDRASAIESAILEARRGDIVVIAGKGHESTQEIDGVSYPFIDADVARTVIRARMEVPT